MRRWRLISVLLVLAGVGLLAVAALHYFRGYEAQRTGRRAWEEARARPVPTLHVPTPTAKENPSILQPSPPPSAEQPQAPPYPRGQPIARLRIPSAEMDYVVFGGADPETLEKGPGHVPGTEMPGEDTGRNNCVITGHRDSHFRRLGWLRKGHRIELETPSGSFSYRVVSREIVKPDAVRVLQPTAKPRLTLITCYPFNYVGAAPERLVVVAEPVLPEDHARTLPARHPS
ncbi:MAG TPA: class D sortase [Thermoanaerobaculia bacterium]|nr:class D sortase [Thermoanaerobaculia bacterium]